MSAESERSVISLCIRSSQAFRSVQEIGVESKHFDCPDCRLVWDAMVAAEATTGEVSVLTVYEIQDRACRERVQSWLRDATVGQNAEAHARQVLDAYWRRMCIGRLQDLQAQVRSHPAWEPLDTLRALVQDAMQSLATMQVSEAAKPKPVAEILPAFVDEIETRMELAADAEKSTGIPTGFTGLNIAFNSGWHRGAMYTVCARAGRGKTTFALCAALAAAAAGKRTIYATVEMTAADLATKIMSNQAMVIGGRYQSGRLSGEEIDRTVHAVKTVATLPLWIDDLWLGHVERLADHCRRLKRSGGLDLIVVDYVGLAKIAGRFDSTKDRISAISKFCKQLALEMDAALILLAQLNRDAKKATRPGIEHVAMADDIGHDSDGVVMIYRTNDEDPATTMISVAKNRWGKEFGFPVDADLARNIFKSANVNWEAFRDV